MDGGRRHQSQHGGSSSSSGNQRGSSGSARPQTHQSVPTVRADITSELEHEMYAYNTPVAQFYGGQYMHGLGLQDVRPEESSSFVQSTPISQQYDIYSPLSVVTSGAGLPAFVGVSPYHGQQFVRQSSSIDSVPGQFASTGPYVASQNATQVLMPPPSQYQTSVSSQPVHGNSSHDMTHFTQSSTAAIDEGQARELQPSQRVDRETLSRRQAEANKPQYEQELRNVFSLISADRVREASTRLLGATRWLVDAIKPLGLHHDDETQHSARIVLWQELNHAWEGLGQKQKSLMQVMAVRGGNIGNLLSSAEIKSLVDELVSLCDQIDRFGLVDYEMGIWEEQIVSVFEQCLDLFPSREKRPGGSIRRKP